MKNAVFRGVASCRFIINRRLGGTCRLHLQVRRNNASEEKYYRLTLYLGRIIFSSLKLEAICSSETLVYNKPTRHHIQRDVILHSHCREYRMSYIVLSVAHEHAQKGTGHTMR
jgi:hypothetical protein